MKAIAELTIAFALGQIIDPMAAAYLQKNFDLLAPSIFAVVVLLFALLALATINKKVSDAQCTS